MPKGPSLRPKILDVVEDRIREIFGENHPVHAGEGAAEDHGGKGHEKEGGHRESLLSRLADDFREAIVHLLIREGVEKIKKGGKKGPKK